MRRRYISSTPRSTQTDWTTNTEKEMIKTGLDLVLKPLHWEKKDNKKGYTGLLIIRALNVQLAPEVYSYYQIERQSNTGIHYLSVVVENNGDEEEFYLGVNSMDMEELMSIAEKDRVKNLDALIKHTISPADISKTLMPPLKWKDVEITTRYGNKSCIYAKILSLSEDGELYFLITQMDDTKLYLEIKANLDSEDTIKEYLYSSYDVDDVKAYAEKYRMDKIANSLLN
nr:MAG TPA: hypothetical protein [Crassvirales sp.]